MVSRARWVLSARGAALAVVLSLATLVGSPTSAGATTCGATASANPILFGCSPLVQSCTISSAAVPAGCNLDFGTRKVTFTGVFDLTVQNQKAAALVVSAGQIVVQGTIKASSSDNKQGGSIQLNATDSITVSGTLDVSGDSAGLIRMRAGGLVNLPTGSTLRAKGLETSSQGNTASGGTIDIVAGTSFTDQATIDLSGGSGGGGGSFLLQAGTTILVQQSIDLTGGSSDGGDLDFTAGDDIELDRTIDVSSNNDGGGGSISARAGVDRVGGVNVGGKLTVLGNMVADGNTGSDGGWDGGDITLRSFGPVNVSGTLHAAGGPPDGGGGSVTVDSSDNVIDRVTNLDGDLTLSSVIDVHGPNAGGADVATGGDVEIFTGRDGTITGSMDVSGSDDAGTVSVTGGRTVSFGASVFGEGTFTDASGATISIESGRGSAGTLAVTRTLDASATNGLAGGVSLKGCGLTLASGLTVTAKTGKAGQAPKIDLISNGTLSVGASGVYVADPNGRVALVHPANVAPQIGGNVTFSPTSTDVVDPTQFPNCAVCGNGIREVGEPCDNGAAADGACCNADCSAFTCPTVTPTPTVTATATGPTRSPTPTRTRTPLPTRTATPTFTVVPTGPTPTGPTPTVTPTTTPPPTVVATATPILPFVEPKTVIDCEKALSKSSSTLVLTTLKTLETCALETFKCIQSQAVGNERTACLASTSRRCDANLAKLDGSHAKFRSQFLGACGGEPPAVPIELMRSPDVLGFSLLQPECFGLDLSSSDAILGCLQILSPCDVEQALGVAVPRVGDLLTLVAPTAGDQAACLPPPLGVSESLAGLPVAPQVVRCERAVATSGRKLLTRQLSVARSCVDSLLKCRLTGKPHDACAKLGVACSRKLATLDDPTTGARAKMLGAIHNACGILPPDVLRDASGIGYAAIDARCAELGLDPASDSTAMAECVTRAYSCAGSDIVRQTLPLVDDELARVGLKLGDDAFCALPTPTPTPTATRTATVTPTPTTSPTPTLSATPTVTVTVTGVPTPTATFTVLPTETPTVVATATPVDTGTPVEPPTPTVAPTPGCPSGVLDPGEQCDYGDDVAGDGCDPTCRFEVLIPGGGTAASDCIAEWAVINPTNSPALGTDGLPSFKQTCVDGDPTCDADGAFDGKCTFRVALCFQNVDPNLPTCSAPPGIEKYVLVSPRPNSSDAGDAANALALVDAFTHLSSVAPSGNSTNTLVFDPPLVVAAPDNCTDTALIVVDRRGLSERSEKFRGSTSSVPPTGGTRPVEDVDTLLLTCLDSPPPTATPTVTALPTPAATATP